MTLPAPSPCDLSGLAAKALSLLGRLGISEQALDELLTLPPHGGVAEQRARPRVSGLGGVQRWVCAYADAMVESLGADPRLPSPLAGGGLAAAVARLRLLVRTRDTLIDLAGQCEAAAVALADGLTQLTQGLAPLSAPLMRPARVHLVGRSHATLPAPPQGLSPGTGSA
ncbi:MAG: hypothetical protein RMK29_12400 [Myxococcales bacterium]|nr:hypothetical protein [Myxococcota bacterium]MDW8282506.1 hypothetical protein [Myxococcales bacterium]